MVPFPQPGICICSNSMHMYYGYNGIINSKKGASAKFLAMSCFRNNNDKNLIITQSNIQTFDQVT